MQVEFQQHAYDDMMTVCACTSCAQMTWVHWYLYAGFVEVLKVWPLWFTWHPSCFVWGVWQQLF